TGTVIILSKQLRLEMLPDSLSLINRIRGIANYQFGCAVGQKLFPEKVEISISKRTGRVRHIYYDHVLLATLRPTDSIFSLTIEGAKRLRILIKPPRFRVVILSDVEEYVRTNRDVFARHVLSADEKLLPGEEVLVTNKKDELLAVGKAVLTGMEMLSFKRGVAVKVRRGIGGYP
ncbi:MAG: tRNA-guanine(15) transglycosylase, partial [Candidatus Bathyarchaeota archaeon]